MKDLEKQIEKAAKKDHPYNGSEFSWTIDDRRECFIEGAKSTAAKEYWQEGTYFKEDLNEAFKTGYNKAISSINEDRFDEEDNAPTFEQWFNFYKKQ